MNTCMRILAVAVAVSLCAMSMAAAEETSRVEREGIKAYCIDFNWGPGGPNAFTAPGIWADADPKEHVKWYKQLGANVIQTFAVSCNGYAWYKDGIVPQQPGLKHDFLTEMVELGHQENMKVMGYFCIAANTRWGQLHPAESYGVPSGGHIPLTKKYNKFLADSMKDALTKTKMDGFMIDWVFHGPLDGSGLKWLPCEIEMWAELMEGPFPGKDNVTKEQEIEFTRRSVDRCWGSIKQAAKSTDPDCIIWLTLFSLNHPQAVNSRMVKEVDWLMNEGGSVDDLKKVREELGRGNLINCLAAWNAADPRTVVPDSLEAGFGLYGFTRPVKESLLPGIDDYYLAKDLDALTGDEANIAMLARAYRGIPIPPSMIAASNRKPVVASSTWAQNAGYEADKINDGNRNTRWGGRNDVKSAWVEIDLEEEMTIGKVKLYELADRVRDFAIEYRSDKSKPWQTALRGTTIGNAYAKEFAPVSGRYFRLNIKQATDEPTLWEFQLFTAEQ